MKDTLKTNKFTGKMLEHRKKCVKISYKGVLLSFP